MPNKQRQKQIFDDVDLLGDLAVTGNGSVAGNLTLTGDLTVAGEVTATPSAATATSDGLTTGLLDFNMGFVTVTSADANNIVTLPVCVAGDAGKSIHGKVTANGCEMRTPASSGATINDADSDGTNEAAIPADAYFKAVCVAADTWVLTAVTKGGAAVATITPDAS